MIRVDHDMVIGTIKPKDEAEELALFRAAIIGPLLHRQLDSGQRGDLYRELAAQRHFPPGSDVSRTYSVATLERWVRRYSESGLDGLKNRPRSDRGHAVNSHAS